MGTCVTWTICGGSPSSSSPCRLTLCLPHCSSPTGNIKWTLRVLQISNGNRSQKPGNGVVTRDCSFFNIHSVLNLWVQDVVNCVLMRCNSWCIGVKQAKLSAIIKHSFSASFGNLLINKSCYSVITPLLKTQCKFFKVGVWNKSEQHVAPYGNFHSWSTLNWFYMRDSWPKRVVNGWRQCRLICVNKNMWSTEQSVIKRWVHGWTAACQSSWREGEALRQKLGISRI